MRVPGELLTRPILTPAGLAALSLVVMIAGATVSGSDALSGALVAAGLAIGVWPAMTRRGDAVVRAAAAIGLVWVLYGALVGSLPTWSDLGQISQWATTEGRVLVSLAAIMIASAITTGAAFRWLLRTIVVVVTSAHAVALVCFFAGWSLPGFRIEWRGLFFGLSSSHHVVSFLSVAVAVIAVGARQLLSRWWRWAGLIVAVVAIVGAGSRTALLGLLAGAVVIAWFQLDRRRLWRGLALGAMVVVAVVVASPRFRTTAGNLVDPDFLSAGVEAFRTADKDVAHGHATSEAEANMLLRLAYWGEAANHITDSPFVGMGAFRQNDLDLTFSGAQHIAYLATGGQRMFNDSEPHNVILYLLIEVGVVGMMLFAMPYVIAWRRTALPRRATLQPGADAPATVTPPDADDVDPLTCAVLVRAVIVSSAAMSMVSSGVLSTGLGIVANAVVFGAAAVITADRRGTGHPGTATTSAAGNGSEVPGAREPIDGTYRLLSRALDVVVSVVALVLTLPLLVLIAVCVKATSRGPVLFRHQRVGQHGELFDMLKFRTMHDGTHSAVLADPAARAEYVANGFKLDEDDPRITPVGRWLRKSSLDELPQLLNVLSGRMSVVGARPIEADQLAERTEADRELYSRKRPGMTGLWQVAGRSSLPDSERIELDRDYLAHPSVRRDVAILLRTPAALARTHEAK